MPWRINSSPEGASSMISSMQAGQTDPLTAVRTNGSPHFGQVSSGGSIDGSPGMIAFSFDASTPEPDFLIKNRGRIESKIGQKSVPGAKPPSDRCPRSIGSTRNLFAQTSKKETELARLPN